MSNDDDYYERAWEQAQRDQLIDPAECGPDEVDFTVRWRQETAHVLSGSVTAWNVSGRAWRITGKPAPVLIAADGQELVTEHQVTLEGRFRDWVIVQPGAAVVAPLSISGWDGTELADYFLIRWPGGRSPATVQGRTHPREHWDRPVMTSSSWFAPLNLSTGPPLPPLGDDLEAWHPPRASREPTGADEVAAFVRARLADTGDALIALHRARCGTPPNRFALDQNGERYEVPPCLCDRDIRRARGELNVQEQVVAAALGNDAPDQLGPRILRLLATNHSDHPDFRREWDQ